MEMECQTRIEGYIFNKKLFEKEFPQMYVSKKEGNEVGTENYHSMEFQGDESHWLIDYM